MCSVAPVFCIPKKPYARRVAPMAAMPENGEGTVWAGNFPPGTASGGKAAYPAGQKRKETGRRASALELR